MNCKDLKKIYETMCENPIDMKSNYKSLNSGIFKDDLKHAINCIEIIKLNAIYCNNKK